MTLNDVTIRALTPFDAGVYRALRLEALATEPEAFSSSHEEESALPAETFRDRIPRAGPSAIFGAFDGKRLVGMAGFVANARLKQRHKGALWGVFVQPQWRRRGIGERLVRRVVEHAADHHHEQSRCPTALSAARVRRLWHRAQCAVHRWRVPRRRVAGAQASLTDWRSAGDARQERSSIVCRRTGSDLNQGPWHPETVREAMLTHWAELISAAMVPVSQ
jgi:GNAT superfamily N-acetyltransferase